MADFIFEGDVDSINKTQYNYISEVLVQRGFTKTKVQIEDLGLAGDNYMANVKRITAHDADGKPFKMIAKVAPTHEQMRFAANTHHLFCNEHIMYTEVLPKYRQLQRSAEVPERDILKFAECYGTLIDVPNELILLEDLKESNFVMLDRFKSITDECVRDVLKNLAVLHSLSFVLKDKEPQTFEELRQKFFDLWSNLLPETEAYFGFMKEIALTLVNDNDERTAAMKCVDMSKLSSVSKELSKTDSQTRYTVIKQGDAWTNNIMFKFDNDTLAGITMIDYQISSESNPTFDILYMILNCTDHQLRSKHFPDWINYYHDELDRSLANYGLKASYIYPKDRLDVDLKRYGKLMFSLGVVVSHVMTMKSDEAVKLKNMMEQTLDAVDFSDIPASVQESDNKMLFKSKVEGLIDTCIEFGLF